MDGILLVDKPAGWTSHDVVAKVRNILRIEIRNQQLENSKNQVQDKLISNSYLLFPASPEVKVGHTGTLDPMATGLLILVLGKYTKRAAEFSKLDKTYQAELTLGSISTTGDIEGDITPKSTQRPPKSAVEAVLSTFLGEISQTPPQYSAIKISGQPAYKAARAGKTVVIEPRNVKIYSITGIKYDYPKLGFTASVSSGTYIRSLAADIGEKLGTSAYLSALRRTQVGEFNIGDAHKIDGLTLSDIKKHLQK